MGLLGMETELELDVNGDFDAKLEKLEYDIDITIVVNRVLITALYFIKMVRICGRLFLSEVTIFLFSILCFLKIDLIILRCY
mmetsp:Transcript_24759/g.49253  ORF Transcript_24759/g.49253 Transcript_24759/m.49253 type:complete len:82 (-) Transcript_24759:20-265(-)